MDERAKRQATLDILSRLAQSRVGERLILVGSSGLHATSDRIPAMTEDVDVLIDADWVAANERELLEGMQDAGFRHLPGTCTLTGPEGNTIDLVGYSDHDQIDRIGGGETIPIMVFGDLSTLLSLSEVSIEIPTGGRALSPAALAVSKLLTIRLEKGTKDKLQALLLIEENGHDSDFRADLSRLLRRFETDRIEDAVADARTALLTISTDAQRADSQAAGYSEMREKIGRGLEVLEVLSIEAMGS